MSVKTCSQCHEEKSLDDFYRRRRSPDGHESECKSCRKARSSAVYERNAENIIRRTRQYQLDHPEWFTEQRRAYHAKHRDERYRRQRERIASDPAFAERCREATRRAESRRRAQKAAVQADQITARQLEELLAVFENRCYVCGREFDDQLVVLHWDHYHPLSKGGAHTIENLRPACAPCNVRKNNVWPMTDERLAEIRAEVLGLEVAA